MLSLLLDQRAAESTARLQQLRTALAGELTYLGDDVPEISIYAAGSLARLEATEHSDLDAFFLFFPNDDRPRFPYDVEIRVFSDVMRVARDCSFPDFSNDGEFLKFLSADDMKGELGSRRDDHLNFFTARMLLLLESTWLLNENGYSQQLDRIIQAYFRDFHEHSNDFLPVFMINDVLRYWRTLCINYEHSREWHPGPPRRSAKGHLRNLKLKFSRMLTCFSFICHLLSGEGPITNASVKCTCELTPVQRLRNVSEQSQQAQELVSRICSLYSSFLSEIDRPKKEALEWIGNKTNRDSAFSDARLFGTAIYELTKRTAERRDLLRFLVV